MTDFIEVNADLHLHGLYSRAVSKNMLPKTIAEQAKSKGLHLVGTADILNAKWIRLVKEQLKTVDEGILEHENGTRFLLQTEIEDNRRVHHIIFFPSFSKAEELREKLKRKSKDLDSDGRPRIWLNAEQIAELCIEAGCLIGPAHAFTPWTAIFKEYNSVKECYGGYAKDVHFLELGLSADTNMADRISELHRLTFLSNSDGHSPWPNKLGREFNTLRIKDISFEEISKALKREHGRKCILNVGFNPLEGKYHKTRCIGCLTFFEPKQAENFKWRCPNCGKPIKKGVDRRIDEIADLPAGNHPEHRPKYLHTIPLSEIIALAINTKNAWSDKVQEMWKVYVEKFGSELKALLEADIAELAKINQDIAKYIQYFREDKIRYVPGGGGIYGKLIPPGKTQAKMKSFHGVQKNLADF